MQMQAGVQCVWYATLGIVCVGGHAKADCCEHYLHDSLGNHHIYTRNEPAHFSTGARKRSMIAAGLDGINPRTHCIYSLVRAASTYAGHAYPSHTFNSS